MSPVCIACLNSPPDPACSSAFARLGVTSVHWESWSACNLNCPFCYRTKTEPLDTQGGIALVGAVAASGARRIVLAGGDPSLRRDLPQLVGAAKGFGLQVEIQTNAHVLTPAIEASLPHADGVGLSLDGPTPEIHDAFRQKPGNFAQVLSLLRMLKELGTPTTVRSVITRENYQSVVLIEPLLRPFTNVWRWSLIQFTPLGDGLINRERYRLDTASFEQVAASVSERLRDWPILDVFRDGDKIGTYALISSDGTLYGVTGTAGHPGHRTVGSMMRDHLTFEASNHLKRYQLNQTQ
jgi:MoaA/NifB/PqqE/SkfB family radical SAM enzyme